MSDFDWGQVPSTGGAPWVTWDNPGDSVTGIVLRVRMQTFNQGKENQKTVPVIDLDVDGTQMALSTSPVDLLAKVREVEPQPGDKLRVKFVKSERVEGKPSPMKVFDVQHRKGERPPVASAEPDLDDYSDEPF